MNMVITSDFGEYQQRRTQLFIFSSSCTLPPYPENGRWNLLNGNGQPGGQISFNSVIQYECDKGYKLTSGSQYRVCNKDWNDSSFRECESKQPFMLADETQSFRNLCFIEVLNLIVILKHEKVDVMMET
ncbi:hypothetical protein NQ318_009093 [Aromia moschata]|uniref:Sushi domain-containing protein n=1 Tax=Aromia moschata TaxID=1265417 RepID=A0AAV8YWZ0_9CUCU|nr:hypothetical protein NQ318_009093 [Aromia moschata]